MVANKSSLRALKFFLFGLSLLFCIDSFAVKVTKTKDVTCKGSGDGAAQLTIKGGTPPYKYTFSGPSTKTGTMASRGSQTVSGLQKGTYTVTVEDKDRCISTGSVSIGKEVCPPEPFTIPVVASSDPNDIIGPSGFGEQKWVSINDNLPYTIRFENDPKIATAAVNKVIITHPIDEMANMFSFRLGNMAFRNFTVEVPPNSSHFFKRLDLKDSIGVYLDITAGLDVTRKQAFWIFQAFDTLTGLPNINPDLGFLLINDTITRNGEGSVSFSIKPKFNSETGDSIKAFASIVFDINAPLVTNVAFNTIDAHPPTSKIASVVPVDKETVKVEMDGTDDFGGSGIGIYQLLVSTNESPYSSYATGNTDTAILLKVVNGNSYKMQTISSDYAANQEALKEEPDTTIAINQLDFFQTPSFASKYCLGNQLDIEWDQIESVVGMYLEASGDSGLTFTPMSQQLYITDNGYTWNIPNTFEGNRYYVIRAVNSANNVPFATSDYFYIKENITVDAGTDQELCLDDTLHLGGSPTVSNGIEPYTYEWSPAEGLNYTNISNPLATQEGNYSIRVADSLGCSNTDEVTLTTHGLSPIYISGLDSNYYENSANDTLYGFPEGGIFSGLGMNDNIFEPSLAGEGEHAITYLYTTEYGCNLSVRASTKILAPGSATITGLKPGYCEDAPGDTLSAIPAGGTFSGPGMVDNIFYATLASFGTHEIKYTLVDTNVTIAVTTVHASPVVSFEGLAMNYCLNNEPDTLTGIPSGGTFSGPGMVNNMFNPSIAGVGTDIINYTFTDNHGCSSSYEQSVTVNAIPEVDLSSNDTNACIGDTLALNAGSGFVHYQWNTGDTLQTLVVNSGGNYSVTVAGNNGCLATDSVQVNFYNIPAISLGKDTSVKKNEFIVLKPQPRDFRSYLWSDNSEGDSLLVLGNNHDIGNHMFWVVVTDYNNCTNNDTINVEVQSSSTNIKLENADNTIITLYPNPTDGILNLKIENIVSADLTIEIINMKGMNGLLKEYPNGSKSITDQLNISHLKSGMYVLKISYMDIVKYITIIKE